MRRKQLSVRINGKEKLTMTIVFDPRFLAKSYAAMKMTSEGEFRLKIIEKYFQLKNKDLLSLLKVIQKE